METNEAVDYQETITTRKVLEWAQLWKQGNNQAEQKLEKLMNILMVSDEKSCSVIPETHDANRIDCVRALVHGGYPVSGDLLGIYAYNLPGLIKDYSDYYNEYAWMTIYMGKFKEVMSLEGLLKRLRDRPIWRVEERYFSTYYDQQTRMLRTDPHPHAIELNRLADYLNEHFETMSLEDVEQHRIKVCHILYGEERR